mmetsp:Transcript_106088/g.242884  ORF Transcript_106088/g.242884 Transcript_106088/m.242884 type:complete len:393 (-) Transcript_106088:370-1548(-)
MLQMPAAGVLLADTRKREGQGILAGVSHGAASSTVETKPLHHALGGGLGRRGRLAEQLLPQRAKVHRRRGPLATQAVLTGRGGHTGAGLGPGGLRRVRLSLRGLLAPAVGRGLGLGRPHADPPGRPRVRRDAGGLPRPRRGRGPVRRGRADSPTLRRGLLPRCAGEGGERRSGKPLTIQPVHRAHQPLILSLADDHTARTRIEGAALGSDNHHGLPHLERRLASGAALAGRFRGLRCLWLGPALAQSGLWRRGFGLGRLRRAIGPSLLYDVARSEPKDARQHYSRHDPHGSVGNWPVLLADPGTGPRATFGGRVARFGSRGVAGSTAGIVHRRRSRYTSAAAGPGLLATGSGASTVGPVGQLGVTSMAGVHCSMAGVVVSARITVTLNSGCV